MCYNNSYIGVCAATVDISEALANVTCRRIGYEFEGEYVHVNI